jgi:DNA mismatch endonuclease, patch repair protein
MRANRAVSRREVTFRLALWREGVRGYRIHPNLPGKPDIFFPGLKLAVFVHGCFWHRCSSCNLAVPTANQAFWKEKFAANAERDARSEAALTALGLETLIVWEHEIRPDPVPRARSLHALIERRRRQLHAAPPPTGIAVRPAAWPAVAARRNRRPRSGLNHAEVGR